MEHQEQREEAEGHQRRNKEPGTCMQAPSNHRLMLGVIPFWPACPISIELFVYLVVLFMLLALWELRRFRHRRFSIPVMAMVATATLLATFYHRRRRDDLRAGVPTAGHMAKHSVAAESRLAVANKQPRQSSSLYEQGEIQP